MSDRTLTIIGILLAVVGLICILSVDDSLSLEEARYCHMVSSGAWPDYKHIYKEVCFADFGPAKPYQTPPEPHAPGTR